MKTNYFITIVIIFLSFNSLFCQKKGPIVSLRQDNWDNFLKFYKVMFVNFFNAANDNNEKLDNELAIVSEVLSEDINKYLLLAKVNVDEEKSLAERYQISNIPSLLIFINGVSSEYKGEKTGIEIISYIKKMTSTIKGFREGTQMEEFIKNPEHEYTFINFGIQYEQLNSFELAAKKFASNTVAFGYCMKPECMRNYTPNTITLFKNKGNERIEYSHNKFSEKAITYFIAMNTTPSLMKFDRNSASTIFDHKIPGLVFFRNASSSEVAKIDNIALAISKNESLTKKVNINRINSINSINNINRINSIHLII